jgi:hypothetical protein
MFRVERLLSLVNTISLLESYVPLRRGRAKSEGVHRGGLGNGTQLVLTVYNMHLLEKRLHKI